MTIPPRIAVTPLQIERVVSRFYARVRSHDELGPIFAAHVVDWPTHEEKIMRFWRNALLLERGYDGNPMQVHRSAGNVRAEHFAIWLKLFDEILGAELSPGVANAWSVLAHRVGRGLQFGLAPEQGAGGPPILRG